MTFINTFVKTFSVGILKNTQLLNFENKPKEKLRRILFLTVSHRIVIFRRISGRPFILLQYNEPQSLHLNFCVELNVLFHSNFMKIKSSNSIYETSKGSLYPWCIHQSFQLSNYNEVETFLYLFPQNSDFALKLPFISALIYSFLRVHKHNKSRVARPSCASVQPHIALAVERHLNLQTHAIGFTAHRAVLRAHHVIIQTRARAREQLSQLFILLL